MITQQEDREIIKSGAFREQYFKLAQNAHIFKILRDGIYSDKPLAVIREYWANARDEHAKIGKPDLPVEITLPSFIEPYLKIRDYGKGLTREEVEEIYISYGTSTKTASNDFIGALGIGSKSGFCYTSAFQVTTFLKGKASIYSCYIDETEMGKIAHISTVNTEEPDGVEISVPINQSDFNLFQSKVKQLFLFAENRPVIKGVRNFTFDEPSVIFKGNDWSIITDDKSYCIMGDIPYVFDTETFLSVYESTVSNLRKEERVRQEALIEDGEWDVVDVNRVIKYPETLPSIVVTLLQQNNITLRFNIGDIEIAASREALSYKTKTILAIYNKIELVINDIKDNIRNELDKCKTLWDVKKHWTNYFHSTRGGVLRNLGLNYLEWNNGITVQTIEDAEIDWSSAKILPPQPTAQVDATTGQPISSPPPPDPITSVLYQRKHNHKLSKIFTTDIYASDNTRIIINDTGITRGVFTAMQALIPHSDFLDKRIYIFYCHNQANRESLEKFFGDNGIPFEYYSKITIPKLTPTEGVKFTNTKNTKKFFAFSNKNYCSKHSDYWDIVDVDPEEDEGVYVVIDRYKPQLAKSDNKHLHTIRKFVEGYEKKPLTIYGVKPTVIPTLGPNWIPLEKHCIEIASNIINDADRDQILADYQELEKFKSKQYQLELVLGVYKQCKDELPITAKLHEICTLVRTIVGNHKKYEQNQDLVEIIDIIGHNIVKDVKPTCLLPDIMENEFFKRYPMLDHCQHIYRHYFSIETKKQFLQDAAGYIKYIESTC